MHNTKIACTADNSSNDAFWKNNKRKFRYSNENLPHSSFKYLSRFIFKQKNLRQSNYTVISDKYFYQKELS